MKEESKLIELFKKYPGIAARIRRSFAYHYDQIQRGRTCRGNRILP